MPAILPTAQQEWAATRHGAWAGRGYRFQDAVAAHVAILMWTGELEGSSITPEGLDDITLTSNSVPRQIQVKSRRPDAGPMTTGQVAKYLVAAWRHHQRRLAGDRSLQLVLVLERLPTGWSSLGWNFVTTQLPSDRRDELFQALRQNGLDKPTAQALMSRAAIVRGVDLDTADLKALSVRLALPPSACALHLRALRVRVGELADENGSVRLSAPASLSAGDVRRILDEVTAVVDVAALEEALQSGICQPVDFSLPLQDEAFYLGVDVVPGHVAAKLLVDRPELVDDVVDGLLRRRSAIILGPSGAGKSGLTWLAVHRLSDRVLWYRASRLKDEDIPSVLRLVDAALPGKTGPVGIVVDNLGQPDTDGWDQLVREAGHRPGVLLLGAVRNEDLARLSTANLSHALRVTLTEDLAARLHASLLASGHAAQPSWREAFEGSNNLLMEFVHLLTFGQRLESTIRAQVRARLADPDRDVETEILRLGATAHTCGIGLRLSSVVETLRITEGDARRAFDRLRDEHLIRLGAGDRVEGLHQLRSAAIVTALNEAPPPTLVTTFRRLLPVVEDADLPTLMGAAERHGYISLEDVMALLEHDLAARGSVSRLAAALSALQQIRSARLGRAWNRVMDERGVPAAQRIFTATWVLTGNAPIESMLPSIKEAVPIMREQAVPDWRPDLVRRLRREDISSWWNAIVDLQAMSRLLDMLEGLPAAAVLEGGMAHLIDAVKRADIRDAAGLLASAYRVDPALAQRVLLGGGGELSMVARLQHQTAWLRNVAIATDDDGRRVLRADYLAIVDGEGATAHDRVVDTCRLSLSCLPTINVAAVRAVDASGELFGLGDYAIADKAIPRENLPSEVQVAATREFLVACALAGPALTRSSTLAGEASLVAEISSVLADAASRWILAEPLDSAIVAAAQRALSHADALPPTWTAQSARDAVSKGFGTSPAYGLARHICANLLPRLFEAGARSALLAGFIGDTIERELKPLLLDEYWRLVGPPPLSLKEMADTIEDLRAVLAEVGSGIGVARKALSQRAKSVSRRRALSSAASLARQRARKRLEDQMARLRRALQASGHDALVIQRELDSGVTWPAAEVCVLVRVPVIIEFTRAVQAIADMARKELGGSMSVVFAPVRDGRVVASAAQRLILTLLPFFDFGKAWSIHLPMPLLDERAGRPFNAATNGLTELSAIVHAWEPETAAHPEEQAAATAAKNAVVAAQAALMALVTDDADEAIRFAVDLVDELAHLVQSESSSLGPKSQERSFGAQMMAVLHGHESEISNRVILSRLALIEWDAAPAGAAVRLEAAFRAVMADSTSG